MLTQFFPSAHRTPPTGTARAVKPRSSFQCTGIHHAVRAPTYKGDEHLPYALNKSTAPLPFFYLLMNFDLIPCGGVNQHSTVPHRTELHRASNIMPCTLCVCFVGVFTVRIDFTTRCSIKIHFTLQPRKLGVKADKFPRRNLTLPPNLVHRGLKSVGIDFTPPMFWIGV